MSLRGIFKQDVVTVTPDHRVKEAATLMRDRKIGDVVVVDKQDGHLRPVGILTDRDLATAVIASTDGRITDIRVADIYSRNIITADENDDLFEVIQRMCENGVARIPVVDSNGALCGILSAGRIFSYLTEELNVLSQISETHRDSAERIMPRGSRETRDQSVNSQNRLM